MGRVADKYGFATSFESNYLEFEVIGLRVMIHSPR
jgi:hypothetical protein